MSSGQEEYCQHVLYVSAHWWVDHLLLNNSNEFLDVVNGYTCINLM